MQLGYIDRVEGSTIRTLPRNNRPETLFEAKETTPEYAVRFFHELRGLGNILLVKMDGRKYRVIGKRGL